MNQTAITVAISYGRETISMVAFTVRTFQMNSGRPLTKTSNNHYTAKKGTLIQEVKLTTFLECPCCHKKLEPMEANSIQDTVGEVYRDTLRFGCTNKRCGCN